MTPDREHSAPPVPVPGATVRFVPLRTKFMVFFGLILILTCSTLTWYFVEGRRALMTANLHRLGSLLLTSVANNGQFRYGALIAEDRATLLHFTESLIALDDVAYVVIRGADGMILAQQNKLVRESSGSLTFTQERRFYPDEAIAQALYQAPIMEPRITPVVLSTEKILVPKADASDQRDLFTPLAEHLYDFAIPVLRRAASNPSLSALPLELEDGMLAGAQERPKVLGVVQLGMSDARARRELVAMIGNALLLTALIIGVGILGAQVLTLRVTTPLRSLASVARQLAEGDIPPPLEPTTHDEVGQLTMLFNMMTRSLHERNVAIHTNLNVIQRQIGQLSALHQTSAAITSTLDLHEVLDTVLQLLMKNLGFSRMLLMLRREDRDVAYVAQLAGIAPEVVAAARELEIPIREGNSLLADLMIHAKSIYVEDLERVASRMHPRIRDLVRRSNVTSFVAVPLLIHSRVLGFLAGDRGTSLCTSEDLSILSTIASHVASAIDNARAYAHLTELTQHLEQRIEERTRELSVANERLQDHDRRRSMFVSVASHELRTPMTAIRSFTDNMLDGVAGPLSERQRTYLTRIGHNLNRLTRIINQLLDWSRLDLQKEVLRLERLCLRQLTTLVVDSLRTVADEKRIGIELHLPEQLPAVCGDPDKIEQVLWNLLGNALKFTPPHGTVSVTAEVDADGFVQICIADTGCGIAPEHLPRIFNEFSKVPSSMATSQGAQLGLFITKSLIAMHGGRIWLESTQGVGTQVWFTIPMVTDGSSREATPSGPDGQARPERV